jgi:hypothetical protein
MGRWQQQHRRGSTPPRLGAQSGLVVIDFKNQGDNRNFLVTFNRAYNPGSTITYSHFSIDDAVGDSGSTSGTLSIIVHTDAPVSGTGPWSLTGTVFSLSPCLLPQSGHYR